jgi:hypothetical protein
MKKKDSIFEQNKKKSELLNDNKYSSDFISKYRGLKDQNEIGLKLMTLSPANINNSFNQQLIPN